MIFNDKQVTEAIERIARTPDGRILHIGLQRALMALSPSPESGALQVFEGGRRFAQQIKAVMDNSISEISTSGRPDSERPIVIVAAGGIPTRAGRGTRRRINAEPDPAPRGGI